jgi:hypothetical protein
MLSLIPVPVQTALEAEFHLQVVTTAYAKHLNDELAAVQATVPQAALPPLPQLVTKVTPGKAAKLVAETSVSNQGKGKQKASDAPPCPRPNITNPIATTAGATTAAAGGTSSRNALGVPGTSAKNALEVPKSDSDDTDDTIPPWTLLKKEHGLTIIYGVDIKNHLKSIKSDTSVS